MSKLLAEARAIYDASEAIRRFTVEGSVADFRRADLELELAVKSLLDARHRIAEQLKRNGAERAMQGTCGAR